ncbi:MAG: ribosome assembly cofactor RimP [Tenacibaculum sp.]
MDKSKVESFLKEILSKNCSLFLLNLEFIKNNKIIITIDGDNAVSLSECISISKKIEHFLNAEQENLAIEVTTPNVNHPLKLKRQYKKNIGRTLKVKTEEAELEAKLVALTDKHIHLKWKEREPKSIGRGKHTVIKSLLLPFDDIKEARVKIVFQ